MASPTFYNTGHTPKIHDPMLVVAQKTLGAIIDGGGGGGGGGGSVTTGTGSPEGSVTGAVGDLYYDTSGDALWVKRTGAGNTGWSQLI